MLQDFSGSLGESFDDCERQLGELLQHDDEDAWREAEEARQQLGEEAIRQLEDIIGQIKELVKSLKTENRKKRDQTTTASKEVWELQATLDRARKLTTPRT